MDIVEEIDHNDAEENTGINVDELLEQKFNNDQFDDNIPIHHRYHNDRRHNEYMMEFTLMLMGLLTLYLIIFCGVKLYMRCVDLFIC